MATATKKRKPAKSVSPKKRQMAKEELAERAKLELARRSLHEFVVQAWPVLEPEAKFVDTWHISAICAHLEAVNSGRIQNLLVNVPPGTMKSYLVCVFWPAWTWIEHPGKRFMFSSYSEDLSMRDSMRTRKLLGSEWYQSRWPMAFSDSQDTKGKFENTQGGWRMIGSVTGKGIGEHPDINCFAAGVTVYSEHGEERIEDVVKRGGNVRVKSFNHATGCKEWRRVTSFQRRKGRKMVEVTFRSGRRIVCTEDHPTFSMARGYVGASVLKVGESVFTLRQKEQGVLDEDVVKHVGAAPAEEWVYNLSVEGNENYFANGVLVHNCVDDPHNVLQAESDAERQTVTRWIEGVFLVRGVVRNVKRVVIMQRLHQQDASGVLLDKGGWTHICHDDETEVLTENGWLAFNALTGNERVATVDPSDLGLTFEKPISVQHKQYHGPMLEWKCDNINMCVTPDHRVVYKDENDVKAIPMKIAWRVRPAHQLPNAFYIPQAAYTKSIAMESVTFAGRTVKAESFLAFMAYYLSEGCFRHRNNRPDKRADVVISQNAGETLEAIKRAVEACGFKYRESWSKDRRHCQVCIRDKQLWDYVSQFGKSADKHIPKEVFAMSQEQIVVFLMAYKAGDGWTTRHGGVGLVTISKRMANQLQMLFVMVGWTCGLGDANKDTGGLRLQQRISKRLDGNIKAWGKCLERHRSIKHADGELVHCVSVSTGAVMCRRNGKPFVSGNCLPMRYEAPKDLAVDGVVSPGKPRMNPTPLGWTDPRKVDGELLWPEAFSEQKVATLEVNLGLYGAAGQLQQRPTPRGGGMFQREWFGVLTQCPTLTKVVRYWDKAGTQGGSGAESAGVLMAQYRDESAALPTMRLKYVILDAVSFRKGAAEREAVIKQTAELDKKKFGFVETWVEQEPGSGGKESAEATVGNLDGVSCRIERVTGSKEVRAAPLASQASVGKVKVLAGDFAAKLLDELEMFPMGKLKDLVDGCSGAYNKLSAVSGFASASVFGTGSVAAEERRPEEATLGRLW